MREKRNKFLYKQHNKGIEKEINKKKIAWKRKFKSKKNLCRSNWMKVQFLTKKIFCCPLTMNMWMCCCGSAKVQSERDENRNNNKQQKTDEEWRASRFTIFFKEQSTESQKRFFLNNKIFVLSKGKRKTISGEKKKSSRKPSLNIASQAVRDLGSLKLFNFFCAHTTKKFFYGHII